ncbi:MAG: hypothetical protein FWD93_02835 [Coriobacteriia bacterium]|nr:hypothetical protein [Coriobacteriia bacterium]
MKQVALPKRRDTLLLKKDMLEQQQARKQRDCERKQQKALREARRLKRRSSLPAKVSSYIGNVTAAIVISLILTLSASYLATQPHILESVLGGVERHLGISLAGAVPPDGRCQTLQSDASGNLFAPDNPSSSKGPSEWHPELEEAVISELVEVSEDAMDILTEDQLLPVPSGRREFPWVPVVVAGIAAATAASAAAAVVYYRRRKKK